MELPLKAAKRKKIKIFIKVSDVNYTRLEPGTYKDWLPINTNVAIVSNYLFDNIHFLNIIRRLKVLPVC